MHLKPLTSFQQKQLKNKVKKKTLPKKTIPSTKKANSTGKDESKKVTPKKLKPVPSKVKTKKATKPKPKDSDNSSDDSDSERETEAIDRKPVIKKLKKSIGRKVAVVKSTDVKNDVVVRKRMASLNASAMMAASYEVERQFDKCEEKMYKKSPDTEEHISPPKKVKDIKNEVLEPKEVCIHHDVAIATLPLVQVQ